MPPVLSEEEAALDPYALLNIEPSASEKEVKKAFRTMSLKYHPDKNQTPEAAVLFRQISLSLEILNDVAKRSYLDNRLETDRRRKEQYAASNKKRKDLIDALNAREEDAKKAKVEQVKQRQQLAEEETIKDAGKRMLEEAQRRALATQPKGATLPSSFPTTNGHLNGTSHQSPAHNGPLRTGADKQPNITPEDLTLVLQFPTIFSIPASSSSSDLQSTLQNQYGPINHVILSEPPIDTTTGKKKKRKRSAIVEFGKGNWGGCWACWKDHDEGSKGARGLEGVRAKWAAGRVPEWVDWAGRQSNGHVPQSMSAKTGNGSEVAGAPSFGSAPDLGGSTMADLLAQHSREKERKTQAKKLGEEFESMTLLRMRQMERDRLAEQIRREEEAEGVA